jgi:Family of unknown function (DUF5999)
MDGNALVRVGQGRTACRHTPRCPAANSADRLAARVICDHLDQGWELLCNGVVAFDDHGALLPDGRALPPMGGRAQARLQRSA